MKSKELFPTFSHQDLFEGAVSDIVEGDIIRTGSLINDDSKEWIVISILKPLDQFSVRLKVEDSKGSDYTLTFGKEVILSP